MLLENMGPKRDNPGNIVAQWQKVSFGFLSFDFNPFPPLVWQKRMQYSDSGLCHVTYSLTQTVYIDLMANFVYKFDQQRV